MGSEPHPSPNPVGDVTPTGDISLEGVIGLLIAILVLIIFSMIFSSSESAFLSINKLRVRFLRSKKDKKAIKVGKLLDRKDALLNTVLVGNNIVNIAITSLLTSLALQLFGTSGVGIATIVATVLLLIFGEISPKTVGTGHPEAVAFLFTDIIAFLMKLLSPLVFIFTRISRFIAKFFGVNIENTKVSFTEDEIKNFIDVGEEEGVLEENEKKLMHRVFRFTDLAAKDIMIPRTKIKAIPLTASYQAVIELSQTSRFSRFPVYGEDIDDIVGVLYVKDLMFYSTRQQEFSVKKIMRPPLFIVGTKKMSSVQQMLRENKQSLAIVIDEYSGTDGILTTEDITEEIFGKVEDEYYTVSDPMAVQISDDEVVLDGSVKLSELSERLGATFTSEFYETLAGYLSEKLDKVPEKGDVYKEQGFVFTVEEADATKIHKVHLKKEEQI